MKKLIFIILAAILCGCENFSKVRDTSREITIFGVVSDATDGALLANATIRDEYTEFGNIGSVVTGSDGCYEFHVSSSSNMVMLLAEKEGYESQTHSVFLETVNKDNTIKVDFKLRRTTIQYKGIVTDVQDIPLSNVKVYATMLQGSYRKEMASTFSNENGEYILLAPNQENYSSWSYTITASKEGYRSQSTNMGHTQNDNGKNFTINFQLDKQ